MIEHVRRRATRNSYGIEVYVVSGDDEVIDCVNSFGGKTIKSNGHHINGTSRCAEAAATLNFDHIIIAQGDEILLLPRHLDNIIQKLIDQPNTESINCVAPIKSIGELTDLSIVKCLIGTENEIKMMFRYPPVSNLVSSDIHIFKKVLGLFSFSKGNLLQIAKLKPTPFENLESIEQMRMLENNFQITANELDRAFPSVNIETDVRLVEDFLLKDREQFQMLMSILNAKAE
jgi:3-deoxy-manno-octulosonate cytidylyltransferase (CMP-KDO synthetase)